MRRALTTLVRPIFIFILLSVPAQLFAQVPSVRFREGAVHGFLSLSTTEGKLLASGDLIQTVRGDRVDVHTVFHFKDGSLDDERTVYSQRGTFKLISDHHIQKGGMFPKPTDVMLNAATGQVTVKYEDDHKEKVDTQHLDLPPDIANGIVLNVVKNLTAETAQLKLSFVAATPKPRLVHLNITREDQARFSIAGAAHKAFRYKVKIELGGVTGAIAPIVGKQPTDIDIWILDGPSPAFARMEGAFYPEGPIWVIQLAAPALLPPDDSKH